MKEKVIFYMTLVGSMSAAIVFGINSILSALEVDATGYTDIINLVGIGLAIIILLISIIFFGKYTKVQRIETEHQNTLISNVLNDNANLIQTILPDLADKILFASKQQATQFLEVTESKINNMVTEMLPTLAEQTMQIVTQKSQDLVEQTTTKATSVMQTMDELIPTYAKQISDNVAQTVRENNAHYHKMLSELKTLMSGLPEGPTSIDIAPITQQVDTIVRELISFETVLKDEIKATITSILGATEPTEDTNTIPTIDYEPTEDTNTVPTIDYEPTEEVVDEPTEEVVDEPTEEVVDEPTEEDTTQNEDNEEKSDESKTA